MGLALAVQQPSQLEVQPLDPFQPQNMDEMMKFAQIVSNTDFAPKEFRGKPESCFVAMLYGRQLGVEPLQAIQNIYVVNGRPTLFGDLLWALIVSHPDFVDAVEDVNADRAIITLTRRHRTPNVVEFSKKDAETAGLWDKTGPWKTNPKRMMLFRARTFAARNLFPDALKGITSREEAEDYIEGEVVRLPQPDPAAELERARARTEAAAESIKYVTDVQIRDWNKARRESGKSPEDARKYIEEVLKIKRSGEMRVEDFAAAMEWAQKPAETKPASEPAAAQISADEKAVRTEMNKRGCLPFAVTSFIDRNTKDGVTDWPAVMKDVQANA